MLETKKEQVRRCREICRERGLALTVQRRMILEAMLDRGDHPSADQIYEEVKDRVPGVSRMTVYRNLDALKRLGIIAKLHHLSAARFDSNTLPHGHLVCVCCGKVVDFSEDAQYRIEAPRAVVHGFHIRDYELYFRGTCAECRRKGPKRATPSSARGRWVRGRRVGQVRGTHGER